MPLDSAQNVPEVLSVRPVVAFGEFQLQWLSRHLHEIHELVDFQQHHERVQQAVEIAIH